jgi:prophage regulatory protein
MTDVTLLRLKAVLVRTGLSRSAMYRLIDAGSFPRPIPLAGTAVKAWPSDQVAEWVSNQIATAGGMENSNAD